MTWATDNRWSAGAAAGRTEIPEDSPAAYAARWIDQGARCDVLPDRQGFAYNDQADRDRLIVKLSAEDYARNMPALDNDVATLLPGDHGEWRVWMRRAGGYVYVDAWLVPEVETPPAHWFAEGSRVDDSDDVVTPPVRAAIIRGGDAERVAAYLPRGYEVVTTVSDGVLIGGRDSAGWTLDEYVLPRLASGLMFGNEVAVVWCDDCGDCPVWACGDLCEACESRQG